MNKRPEWWEWTEKDIEDAVNHIEKMRLIYGPDYARPKVTPKPVVYGILPDHIVEDKDSDFHEN